VERKINAGDSSGETVDRTMGVTAFATLDTSLVPSPDCNDRAGLVRKIHKGHGELYDDLTSLRRGYRLFIRKSA